MRRVPGDRSRSTTRRSEADGSRARPAAYAVRPAGTRYGALALSGTGSARPSRSPKTTVGARSTTQA